MEEEALLDVELTSLPRSVHVRDNCPCVASFISLWPVFLLASQLLSNELSRLAELRLAAYLAPFPSAFPTLDPSRLGLPFPYTG